MKDLDRRIVYPESVEVRSYQGEHNDDSGRRSLDGIRVGVTDGEYARFGDFRGDRITIFTQYGNLFIDIHPQSIPELIRTLLEASGHVLSQHEVADFLARIQEAVEQP